MTHRLLLLISLIACLSVCPLTSAATLTVCQNGSCQFTSIQAAVDAANPGDVIQISTGTYLLEEPIEPFGKAITIRGSVDPITGLPATILDAQSITRAMICVNGEGPGTLLENLVFTNGINTYGGALTCVKSSPRLRFCVFFKNRSVLQGGAVFMTSGAAPDFYQCLFIENECSGFAGGAIAATIASQPVFTGCDFVGNQSAGYGAAVYLGEASATFDGCDFIGNATLVSGGAMQLTQSSPSIQGCLFRDNLAGSDGGAIKTEAGSNPVLSNNGFCANIPTAITGSWTDAGGNCFTLVCDTDNDETIDCFDGCPNDPDKTDPGVCGCGTPDTDSDQDGTLDCLDGCPNDSNKTDPGVCGCGTPDTDSDQDGTLDCLDGCPDDPDKTDPGACGCGSADTDTDGDAIPDCIDPCPEWSGECSEDGETIIVVEGQSIQDAFDAVPDGGTITVGSGTYPGPIDFGDQSFILESTDGPATTILDGSDLVGVSLVTIDAGAGTKTVLRGFTLRNANVGGGLGPEGLGGALSTTGSSPTIEDCIFTTNTATAGGAIHFSGGAPTVRGCTFSSNQASSDGGALVCSGSDATIIDCTFENNTAGSDGGAIHTVDSFVTFQGCLITGNTANTGDGGGLTVSGGSIDGSTITGNAAPAGSGGGAFITASASDEPLITDATLCDNAPNQIDGGTWTDGGGNTICAGCPGDLDGSGTVDGADLTKLLADWGCTGTDCIADINGSGTVDGADLTIILSAWGACG